MSEANVAEFRSVAQFLSGGTPSKARPEFWNGDIPWVSPKDMGPDTIDGAEDHISLAAVHGSATRLVPAGSLLAVARSGILARRWPVALTTRDVAFNQDIKAILVDRQRLDPEFALWWLRSQEQDVLQRGVKKGATVHSLQSKFVEEMRIPLPPLEEQRRIVDILNRAASIRRLRDQANATLRALIPALFIKMFGDPVENPMGWERAEIGDLFTVRGGKRLPKGARYSDEPTPHRYVRAADIEPDEVIDRDPRYISSDLHAGIARYVIDPNDTIITIAGKIGVAAPSDDRLAGANLTENAARLSPRQNVEIDNLFLSCLLNSHFVQRQIAVRTGQVTIGKLALERIKTIEILVPPIERQRRFKELSAAIRSSMRLASEAAETAESVQKTLLGRLLGGGSELGQ